MVTKREIIYDILSVARQGQIANSEPLSEELVGFWIDSTRIKLIRQDLNKRHSINPDIVQTLCVELEITDATTCPCEITDCTVLRSKKEIPEAIETHYRNLIISAGPVALTQPRFSFMDYHRAIYFNPSPYSRSIPGVFLYNKRLYVVYHSNRYDMLQFMSVELVLERPEEAKNFSCAGQPCYTDESKYPISSHMLEDLKTMIIQTNLKIATVVPSDQTADSKHNLQQNLEQ